MDVPPPPAPPFKFPAALPSSVVGLRSVRALGFFFFLDSGWFSAIGVSVVGRLSNVWNWLYSRMFTLWS